MALEELDVGAEVRAEVAPVRERHHDRLQPPDRERGDEDDASAAEALNPGGQRRAELPCRHVQQASQQYWRVLRAEAAWLGRRLEGLPPPDLSPLLSVGSGETELRATQPWLDERVYAPLVRRGVRVLHHELHPGSGVDVAGDLTDPAFLAHWRSWDPVGHVLQRAGARPGA